MIHKKCLAFLISVLVLSGCIRRWTRTDLTPTDKRPVYSTIVSDADEAGLLVQEIKIEPVKLERNQLYFHASNDQLNTMRSLGYAFQQSAAPEVTYRVVEIRRTIRKTESELARTGVLILNREREFWVVRGTLGQLSALQGAGFQMRVLTEEPRPREVKIVVPRAQDIQRVNELGVDILSVTPRHGLPPYEQAAPQRFTIVATAFDYQIDRAKDAGFEVTVLSSQKQQKGKRP